MEEDFSLFSGSHLEGSCLNLGVSKVAEAADSHIVSVRPRDEGDSAGIREERRKNVSSETSEKSPFNKSHQVGPTPGIVKSRRPLTFMFKASVSQVFCESQPKDF